MEMGVSGRGSCRHHPRTPGAGVGTVGVAADYIRKLGVAAGVGSSGVVVGEGNFGVWHREASRG